ncbi:aminoglycoside 3-N-acetyltransferase [Bradyrhizobium lablabi]|uniref:Aminoglycoside N(3)-acetyltransferase n=1 Tax=Bradyrhizobium lablabi TaxID=722472 RepID=A0A1M7B576_9BRAD|nr:AAC(3) family N-acetyltransferase [Bradyrhizobium lablabi]SHL50158.1 aminoglycoside 3-N-acetyltransferase [Bradyrhizobium lablabi]
MYRAFRTTVKRLAQKLTGQSDVRGFVRQQKLWLSKRIYRRPVSIAELRQRLIDLGVTPGRTLWVQSSWNEFYNVPLRPSEMIDLLRDLLGPGGTLAMPAFPIDQNPDKLFLVDRAPVYTGLLCEVFRRYPDVRRSIHLSSSVCALGPNADFLIRDHHHTIMPWGKDSPFCRLAELDARMLGIGAGFEFMTALHAAECLLFDEVPFFRGVFDGTIRYRWQRANGETGEHEYRRRIGDIRPKRLRRHFGPDICANARLSNLRILAADAKPFIERAVTLGRRGITMYIQPVPKPELFVPSKQSTN